MIRNINGARILKYMNAKPFPGVRVHGRELAQVLQDEVKLNPC